MGKPGKKQLTSKNSVNMNSPKDGFIHKKKNQKFKQMPTGKVTLINGSKTQNNKEQKQKENKEAKKLEKLGGTDKFGLNPTKIVSKDNEDSEDSNDSNDISMNSEINLSGDISDNTTTEDEIEGEEDSDDYNSEEVEMEEEEVEEEEDEEDEVKGESDIETDEDEEEDEESESEEEAEKSALGLKALLGNSLAEDDEDDEDFEGTEEVEEDDDISSSEEEAEEEEEKVTEKETVKKATEVEDDTDDLNELRADKRTIFVGNLPKDVNKKKLTKLFKQFGEIDTLRLRGKVPKDIKMSKKVAAITKNLHPMLKSVYAYIRYVSEESVKPALSMNNKVFEGNHLRVNTANIVNRDPKKSVFLGNLPYSIEDDALRKHFKECGNIESVRIIRDNRTGIGKGFGYINFETTDAVMLALKLDGSTLLKREIRVQPSKEQKNKAKRRKRSQSLQKSGTTSPKKQKNTGEEVSIQNKKNATKRLAEKEKKQTSPQQKNTFQGRKADDKVENKKKNKNKIDKKKKQLAQKLVAKPKKPTN